MLSWWTVHRPGGNTQCLTEKLLTFCSWHPSPSPKSARLLDALHSFDELLHTSAEVCCLTHAQRYCHHQLDAHPLCTTIHTASEKPLLGCFRVNPYFLQTSLYTQVLCHCVELVLQKGLCMPANEHGTKWSIIAWGEKKRDAEPVLVSIGCGTSLCSEHSLCTSAEKICQCLSCVLFVSVQWDVLNFGAIVTGDRQLLIFVSLLLKFKEDMTVCLLLFIWPGGLSLLWSAPELDLLWTQKGEWYLWAVLNTKMPFEF